MPEITGNRKTRCLLLDWGDTVMRVFPECQGPMFAWPWVEAVDGVREALTKLRPDWTIVLATNAAKPTTGALHRTIHDLHELPEALELLMK